MQEKYNVTGMTCSACQARVQKSVSSLTSVQECNVNLLKNSMVVTYDDQKCKQWTDYRRCRKDRLWSIPTAGQGKIGCTGCLPGGHGEKEYEAMRRRVIWSFVFTIPLFYLPYRRFPSSKQQ